MPKFLQRRDISDEVKASLSKLQPDPRGASGQRKNQRLPDGRVLAHIANTTIGNIKDARNLFQILPDMDYARQILISATIAPGDLTDTKVLYTLSNDGLDSNLAGPLLRKTQEFFDDSYRIRSLLNPILNDVLFETGSYPILVLPESSVDRIINTDNYGGVSMENAISVLDSHLREQTTGENEYISWGVLGNSKNPGKASLGVSFESLSDFRNYDPKVSAPSVTLSFESMIPDDEELNDVRGNLSKLSSSMSKAIASKGSTVYVMDNMNILKRPMVLETRRGIAVSRIYGNKMGKPMPSMEAAGNKPRSSDLKTLKKIESQFYTRRQHKHVPVQPVMTHKQTGDTTYGHPLVIHLPSESVIPIHVPGNPSEHVAYYILLDIDGNPISVSESSTQYDDIKAQMNNVDSYASQLISQAQRGLGGTGNTLTNEIIDEMGRIYSETVEADLLARLRAGALSGNYELSRTEDINRIMLSRHLKGQRTNILYVPAELLVYIAFDYNEYGVGKSVLEDGKILGSIRAAIMLANTLATINNAVGGKTVEITLDPEDEDPTSTVEFMLSEYAKVNSQGFSRIIGSTHPLGLADQIQNHGVNVVVSGNTRYPETSMNVNQRDGANRPIDTDMEETYRRRHIQMFGLSPETMEGINQADFATTIVQNNLMLLKRVIQNQEKFEPFLTDFVRRYILNSGIFLDEMRELIKANKKYIPKWIKDEVAGEEDQILAVLEEFVFSLEVGLPSPDVDDVQKSMQSFNTYSEALDTVIDAYINEEFFATDAALGMEELVPNIKAVVKAEFQRRWLRKHNVMPELDIFTTVTEEEGSPAFDLLETTTGYLDGLNHSIQDYIKSALKAAKKRAKALEKIEQEKQALEEAKGSSGGDDLGGEGGDTDLGDLGGEDTDETDLGGEDDLDMGDDFDTGEEEAVDDADADGTEDEDTDNAEEEEEAAPEEDEEGGDSDLDDTVKL
jgi:hypothetical protein